MLKARLSSPVTIVLVLVAAAACSSSGGGSGGAGGGGGGGGGGDAGGGAGAGGSGGQGGSSEVSCTASPPVFPAFDKTCAADDECAVKFHQINCCGTRVAIGINNAGSAAFDEAEAACQAMYPGCGCAQEPTKAEDGKTALDESTIQVACTGGACATFVP